MKEQDFFKMDMKTRVAVMECGSYETGELTAKINEGIALIGGWDKWVRPGMTVLLKINLISPMGSDTGAVTHCELVRALTRILKMKGCEVWIGDSAGGAIGGKAQTERSFAVSGIKAVADQEGAVLKNFDKEGVKKIITQSGEEMYLSKPMFDADLVINLPKFKTHLAGAFTGAVKNLYGCIPGQKKAYYHKIYPQIAEFGKVIADINQALSVKLHIMDGVLAMDGQGPVGGRPYRANKILLSGDALALDTVVLDMIGLKLQDVSILQALIDRQLGTSDPEKITVCGDHTAPPRLKGFEPARVIRAKNDFGMLGRVIDFLKTRPKIDLGICKKCNVCVESCPVGAIDKETKKIDYKACIECMCCHELCIYKAVKLENTSPIMRLIKKLKKKENQQ